MTGASGLLIPAWDAAGVLRPMDKLAVHRLGLRHPAVSVFLLCGDRVLIQQRAAGKYHTPGLWANTCCTHPHWDEPPEACAHRRLHEELGIQGVALRHAGRVEYRAPVPCADGMLTEHERVEVFVAHVAAPPPMAPDPDEVQAVDWIRRADLADAILARPEAFTPWIKVYLADHAAMIFGPQAPHRFEEGQKLD